MVVEEERREWRPLPQMVETLVRDEATESLLLQKPRGTKPSCLGFFFRILEKKTALLLDNMKVRFFITNSSNVQKPGLKFIRHLHLRYPTHHVILQDQHAEGVLYLPGFKISPAPEIKTKKL